MISIKFTGSKAIEQKLAGKNLKLRKRHKYLGEDSAYGYIEKVKETLRRDGPEIPQSFNHLYTMNLYKNTKAKSTVNDTADGFEIETQTGYFVGYGLNIETFVPRIVPLSDLRGWARVKKLNWTESQLRWLKFRLKTDPKVYPILQETWEEYKEAYKQIVFKRAAEVWGF